MKAGKGWRQQRSAPGLQVKSCSVEGCAFIGCSVQNLRTAPQWWLQLISSWSCLKTSRVLQIQSSWHGSKAVFCYKLKGTGLTNTSFRKIHPSSMFLLSFVSPEDKCQSGPSWRTWLAAFLLDACWPFSWGCLESQNQHHTAWMNTLKFLRSCTFNSGILSNICSSLSLW